MLFFSLPRLEYTDNATLGAVSIELDDYIEQKAVQMNISTLGIETANENCDAVIMAFSHNIERFIISAIKKTKYLSSIDHSFKIEQYNGGDETLFEDPLAFYRSIGEKAERDFIKHMVVKRNYNMADRIVKLVRETPKRYFFAIGVSHLVGKHDNVIDILRNSGLKVKRIFQTREEVVNGGETLRFRGAMVLISIAITFYTYQWTVMIQP